ncbi:CFEM domain-containing [Pyrenophora seminiperda CCB06]|uniref:CFEM domain-containing n=1 Tax=Pyrenophora seminiperda CCB06 TaxID=1302712 RepID=A0A3M7MBW0_9PLEO|nr:CFEM domain-containing [Pyrenophora seminiperda CCB06]
MWMSGCLLANCTMQESLQTARVQADQCSLSGESKRTEVFTYTIIVYSLAVLCVVLRIAGKLVSKRLSLDDYIVVFAILLSGLPVACVLRMTQEGFGEHLWNLNDGALLSILRYFFVSWSTYVIVLGLIKVSLVFFYLEIFQTSRFRIVAYIVLACVIINSLVIFFITVFICTPIESFWNRDIKNGKCMGLRAIAFANSASAIAQDIVLLVLPLIFIKNLQMKRHRKWAVGFMFCIGTFGCIATILRFHTLTLFKISMDPTWDYVEVTIWTELELAAGFVCVSLPSIRVLIVRFLPKSVKELLSHITNPSKGSNQTPPKPLSLLPPPPRQKDWARPSGWSWISLGVNDHPPKVDTRKSFMSGIWPWVDSGAALPTSTFSSNQSSSSRNKYSMMSNYSDTVTGVAVTQDPYHERKGDRFDSDALELLAVPPNTHGRFMNRDSCRTVASRDDTVTALPSIGCLPERSFSQDAPRRKLSKRGRKDPV